MAIDLDTVLKWKSATEDEILLLQNLQGNILKGHGRDYATLIFFQFDPEKQLESKRFLRALSNTHLTTAHQQLLDTEKFKAKKISGGDFTHLALTFAGYAAIGLEGSAPADPEFIAGMSSQSSIDALSDPPLSNWETPFQTKIHGVILAAQETEHQTAALTNKLLKQLEEVGGTAVHVQHGHAVRNGAGVGIEHFGYVDGRSQPLLLAEDVEQEQRVGGTSRWNPAFPLSTVLVKDPGVLDKNSFGSFFVFRKLEQAVLAFKTREQEIAELLNLTGEERELAGALLVGRFEDGTPVTLSDEARSEAPPNNFNYDNDPSTRCPFHAHIRKTNPRGTGGAEEPSAERKHIMARRGIPYEDKKRTIHPAELPESNSLAEFNDLVAPKLPVDGLGLLFMAYNENIGRQFKFTQQIWANNPSFPLQPPGTHGLDPVIGQGVNDLGAQKLSSSWDSAPGATLVDCPFAGFVTMKGGEYFFSPSMTFLNNL